MLKIQLPSKIRRRWYNYIIVIYPHSLTSKYKNNTGTLLLLASRFLLSVGTPGISSNLASPTPPDVAVAPATYASPGKKSGWGVAIQQFYTNNYFHPLIHMVWYIPGGPHSPPRKYIHVFQEKHTSKILHRFRNRGDFFQPNQPTGSVCLFHLQFGPLGFFSLLLGQVQSWWINGFCWWKLQFFSGAAVLSHRILEKWLAWNVEPKLVPRDFVDKILGIL